jgi:hypothetical protein
MSAAKKNPKPHAHIFCGAPTYSGVTKDNFYLINIGVILFSIG